MDRAIVVSADGHASVPPELWPEYLEKEYHHLLPGLLDENEKYGRAMWPLNNMNIGPEQQKVFDPDGFFYPQRRWSGMWDLEVRLEELDREGVAAELVYFGDFRTSDLFHNVMNRTYPHDAMDAGARAYDRWAHHTFGGHPDRFLLSGAIGSCTDVDGLVAELEWVADHGFVGTYAPGFNGLPDLPPLYDLYWDRVWATYAETGLVPIVHGGYGLDQGMAFSMIEESLRVVEARNGSDMDLVMEMAKGFNEDFFVDLRCRRAMCQLMLGGVFDRNPGLKLAMVEVRADWLPDALKVLDAVYEEHRSELPTDRRPSEWWESNCIAGLSFMHQAEVEIRDEIGMDNLAFGRDYPHTEGTWPNTDAYLKLIFAGVPKDDVRKILGENALRFFGLDRSKLAEIAARIGPDLDVITDPAAAADVDPPLVEHLARRCGVLKPAEGDVRADALRQLLEEDVARIGTLALR
jgi:predicted TIM-barrel fold metal-dependent hydrolase